MRKNGCYGGIYPATQGTQNLFMAHLSANALDSLGDKRAHGPIRLATADFPHKVPKN